MERSTPTTLPAPERLPMTDEDRAERLRQLADRLVSPDGFDRDTLARIEELTAEDQ